MTPVFNILIAFEYQTGDIKMNVIKVFISQPMTGRKKEDILAEREKVIELCAKTYGDFEILDSFREDAESDKYKDKKPLWFLGSCMELLSEADIMICTPGWESSKGCQLERMACDIYHIPMIDMQDIEDELNKKAYN